MCRKTKAPQTRLSRETLVRTALPRSLLSHRLVSTRVGGNTVPPAVNKQEAQSGDVIAGLTVTYLPNRDRDFSQFGQLAAGVQSSPDSTGLIVTGQRSTATKADVDGADFNDPLQGGQRGSHDSGLQRVHEESCAERA
jgi:hypothetical protein